MQFSTVASVAAIAAVVSAASNVTTQTVTHDKTTLVTITSCEDHACSEKVSTVLVSTATVTENGVTTEYTTWCPILASEEAEAAHSHNMTSHATSHATSSSHTVSSFEGAAAKALPAAGALLAGAAALLL